MMAYHVEYRHVKEEKEQIDKAIVVAMDYDDAVELLEASLNGLQCTYQIFDWRGRILGLGALP